METIIETIDLKKNPSETEWLPGSLRRLPNIGVRYNTLEYINYDPLLIYDENTWTFENEETVPTVSLNITFLSGEVLVHKTEEFCFDNTDDTRKVLIVDWPLDNRFFNYPVRKCCYPSEVISENGYCENFIGRGWTPGNSHIYRFYTL